MANLLEAIQDTFEPIKVIAARAGEDDYNTTASALHALAKTGAIARTKDDRGWCFATLGAVAEIGKPEPEPSGLPEWAKKPIWTPGDGPIPDVWSSRGAHSCYWSCVWANEGGPEEQRPAMILEDMSRAQKFYELKDNALRGDGEASSLALNLSPMEEDRSWDRWEGSVDACLRRVRKVYPETASYVGLWSLSASVRRIIQRPGWDAMLPNTERIRQLPDGRWAWFKDLQNVHEPGIPLCEVEFLRGVSEAEQAFAREAKHEADLRQATAWQRR